MRAKQRTDLSLLREYDEVAISKELCLEKNTPLWDTYREDVRKTFDRRRLRRAQRRYAEELPRMTGAVARAAYTTSVLAECWDDRSLITQILNETSDADFVTAKSTDLAATLGL